VAQRRSRPLVAAIAMVMLVPACGQPVGSLADLDGAVGIVGTVRDLAPVRINGLVVATDAAMRIEADHGPAALRTGQVVSLEARQVGGTLTAIAVRVRFEVSGPIEDIAADGRSLRVLGQSVVIDPDRLIGGSTALRPSALTVGQWLHVSGLRDAGGTIIASRLDERPVGGEVSVRGLIEERSGPNVRIGDLTVSGTDLTDQPLAEARIVGSRRSDGVLEARTVEFEPRMPFRGRFETVSLEGFVRGALLRQGFTIGAREVRYAAAGVGRGLALVPGQRVHALGRPAADGGVIAIQVSEADPALPRPPVTTRREPAATE